MERPKCLIKNLNHGDKVGLWVAIIILYAITLGLFAGTLYYGGIIFYTIVNNIEKIFSSKPDLKFCLYTTITLVILFILVIFSIACLFAAINKTIDILNDDLYKFIFFDKDDNIMYSKYETLKWLNNHGYQIQYPDNKE